jgi:hypothetical protein
LYFGCLLLIKSVNNNNLKLNKMEMEVFRTEKQLRVESVSEVKKEKSRTDGKVSREFYTAMYSDAENPFIKWRTRNFFQQHSPDGTEVYWRGANPVNARAMIGKTIHGEILKVPVDMYKIVDANGQEREVDNFTIVIFDGESIEEVVKSYGHLYADSGRPGISNLATGNMPSTQAQMENSKRNSEHNRVSDKPTTLGKKEGYATDVSNTEKERILRENAKNKKRVDEGSKDLPEDFEEA